MSNEKKEIKTYEDLKSFLRDLAYSNPNDQTFGFKARHFINNLDEKEINLIMKEIEK